MADLLLELFSEEIPARMQQPMAYDFEKIAATLLQEGNLPYDLVETYAGPRRLTLHVEGLPNIQPDRVEERRGPRTSAPEKALAGFLRANSLTIDQVEKRGTGKNEFFFATLTHRGRPVKEVLQNSVQEIISRLSWPKSMRWSNGDMRWVRPLKNILALFDGETLPVAFGHLRSNNMTCGHRFLAPETFAVQSFTEYRNELTRRYVVLDAKTRKERIMADCVTCAALHSFELLDDPALLDEVAGLIEWPVVLTGAIDETYMQVPEEVLISSIRTHQKYFCLRRPDGHLAPYFLVVANMSCSDNGLGIRSGNERVLRARLADAAFFWNQDRKVALPDRVPDLNRMVFHATLGSIGDKVGRLQEIVRYLSSFVPNADADSCARAALLCKADLVTEMVGEFPDLQGVMGGYYAAEAGESEQVALAIRQHYAPKGPADTCPSVATSIVVALADKIDTLVGLFAAAEKPTGAKDPFALRRAALGSIRILLENSISLPLRPLIEFSLMLYPTDILTRRPTRKGKTAPSVSEAEVVAEVLDFFEDRLKVSLREQNVRHDLITAVFDGGDRDDLVRLLQRVKTLTGFLASEDGDNLLIAYRRAANILRIEEKKDEAEFEGLPDPQILAHPAEKKLFKNLEALRAHLPDILEQHDYEGAIAKLANLRAPVDAFFEQVTVNADEPDLRQNRLRLLAHLRIQIDQIANFGLIEKEGR